ncbi:RNA-directed DNA polymerase (reverse transcriptase)-related family protein, partial [Striga hermonthica]
VSKSSFIMDHHVANHWAHQIHERTGFARGDLPIPYLGAPLYKGHLSHELFIDVRQRMIDRISGWSHRHLSFGGRLALIKCTLCTLPLHLLAVLDPHQSTIHELDQILARYFWKYSEGSRGRRQTHWVKWDSICRPHSEEFRFVFWAFGPAIQTFHLCPPIINIDGTHLR